MLFVFAILEFGIVNMFHIYKCNKHEYAIWFVFRYLQNTLSKNVPEFNSTELSVAKCAFQQNKPLKLKNDAIYKYTI